MSSLNYVPIIECIKFILGGVIVLLFTNDIAYFVATTLLLAFFSLYLSVKMKGYSVDDNVNSMLLEDYKVSISYRKIDGEWLWEASSQKFPDLFDYADSRREVEELIIDSITKTEQVLNNE